MVDEGKQLGMKVVRGRSCVRVVSRGRDPLAEEGLDPRPRLGQTPAPFQGACMQKNTIAGLAALFLAGGQFAQVPDALFGGMRYRPIGPFRGGRALAVSGVRGQPLTFYFGAVAGGVFRSDNAGQTWMPLFDKQDNLSVGALAVAESDSNVIYVGTGEACIRGNVTYGKGVYRSDDAGHTWRHLGLDDTRQIGRVLVHPRNPDLVYVAALGHAFAPNPQRGVFRSRDGGRSWDKVLFKDADTSAIDLAFDPQNPQVIFAALWQVRRQPWSLESGGPGSGLHPSPGGRSPPAPPPGPRPPPARPAPPRRPPSPPGGRPALPAPA